MRNPFDELEPDARAIDAARALMATLPALAEGKMFGVLVVQGAPPLHAFSGDAALQGFVPHVYDAAARAGLESASDAVVKGLTAQLPSLDGHHAAVERLNAERERLRERHAERRRARHRTAEAADPEQSRADKRERRQFDEAARTTLAAFAPLLRRRAALERLRRIVSQEAMRRMHDTYVLTNALGEAKRLRELFAPLEPPWGAAECAAVKLLQHAIHHRLTPLALAEFWWGPPPPGGGRVHGAFYPACRTKCGPVLPFLMRGLDVEPRRAFRSSPSPRPLEVLHEDERVAVLAKPAGLLSVPGKEETDSVLERLRARHPHAMLVHRLDLDTSGVLLAALDGDTYRTLQANWRGVEKRYVAWLDGEVGPEHGTITLPLRVDLEQRPRQVVDFEHGRSAHTDFEVLERRGGRTRVAFFPRTGRTHQLRVHAAHRDGLGVPIVGDRLYGSDGERLMLHAEVLSFTHPQSGVRVTVRLPAPF